MKETAERLYDAANELTRAYELQKRESKRQAFQIPKFIKKADAEHTETKKERHKK